MQFSALFCLIGRDNGQRFAVISGLIFFALLLAAVLIGATSGLYIVGLLLLPLLILTSYRRLRDSGQSRRFLAFTIVPFVLVLLSLAHSGSVMLLLTFMVLAALAIGYLAILPAVSKTKYQQGYSGPISLSNNAPMKSAKVRVEPTLSGNEHDAEVLASKTTGFEQHNPQHTDNDISAKATGRNSNGLGHIQQWLIANPKASLLAASSLVAVMLLVSIFSMLPADNIEAVEVESAAAENTLTAPSVERKTTTLPDGFSLVLEEDVLIVRWLGETGSPTTLWSLATAKGDRTCAALKFNNGTEYRPVEVSLLADTGTEARFSPLDTEAIIVDMARRGNVSLCGYKFSLKGSQAAIGKVAAFATYL